MAAPQPLPGFRDFYPDECRVRSHIFALWQEASKRFGFRQYDGPPLEPVDLYTRKSGEEIVGQLYDFSDKGERHVALRPEMTPTFARMVGARHREFKKPIKWYAIPQLFRYERAQKGRKREHFQFNADIVGASTAREDAELIALLVEILRLAGLTSTQVRIRLSSRSLWCSLLAGWGVAAERFAAVFAVVDKIEREPREKTLAALLAAGLNGCQIGQIEKVCEGQPLDQLPVSIERDRLVEVVELLGRLGAGEYVQPDLRIVRGLAYYTGVVFEAFEMDEQGAYTGRAIAGGGRYDTLLDQLAGTDLPAAGFGMGDVVFGDILMERGLIPPASSCAGTFVVIPPDVDLPKALGLVMSLRQSGLRIEYPLAPSPVGKQFQQAEHLGARFAVIADSALDRGMIQIKELATRQQTEIPLADLVGWLRARLGSSV